MWNTQNQDPNATNTANAAKATYRLPITIIIVEYPMYHSSIDNMYIIYVVISVAFVTFTSEKLAARRRHYLVFC